MNFTTSRTSKAHVPKTGHPFRTINLHSKIEKRFPCLSRKTGLPPAAIEIDPRFGVEKRLTHAQNTHTQNRHHHLAAAVFRLSPATGRSIPSPPSPTNVASSPLPPRVVILAEAAETARERAVKTLRCATMCATESAVITSLISRWWRQSVFSDKKMCRFHKNKKARARRRQ
ncbi:glutamyl-tRNA(Gln) amidotransferase subunit C [Striga asiatica]|uniref:Glutamyl-tRNA(Gln) amidotransferase subunit C n=1 Tax=Striga asiatica TaxID=4170 RepID=A0A5A7QEW7_STRAF|nr:glutamyl-tRNA(Gln) amidotransferase subunit C [Striga asiatica]